MGFLIILPFTALAGWSIFSIFRWLRRGVFDAKWWRAFTFLGLAGFALGIWATFFLEYKVANAHLEGFPIPIGIANREKPGEPWIKSAMPVSIRFGGAATDLLSGVALCLAPIAVAAFFKEHRGKDPQLNPRPHNPP